MIIGVDVRHTHMGKGTGGAHYLRNALEAFRKYDTQNTYVEYNGVLGYIGDKNFVFGKFAALGADLFVKQVLLPRWCKKNKIDLLLHFLPPCSFVEVKVPQITCIHDITPTWTIPTIENTLYDKYYIPQTYKHSTHIIVGSKHVREELIKTKKVSEDKISLVYHCFNENLFNQTSNLSLPTEVGKDYLLVVLSSMLVRKNPAAGLLLFNELPKEVLEKHKLVIIGAPKSIEDFKIMIPASALEKVKDSVVFFGRMSNDMLANFYRGAAAVLFVSRYEGFGMPATEAAICGTDAIVSDILATRESASPLAFRHAHDDYNGMAQSYLNIISNREARSLRVDVHKNWSKQFHPKNFVESIQQVYEKVV